MATRQRSHEHVEHNATARRLIGGRLKAITRRTRHIRKVVLAAPATRDYKEVAGSFSLRGVLSRGYLVGMPLRVTSPSTRYLFVGLGPTYPNSPRPKNSIPGFHLSEKRHRPQKIILDYLKKNVLAVVRLL